MKISMFTSVTPLLLCAGLGVSMCSPAFAVPAFARKYGLPCSACHEAWPKLNNFGLAFRDNGYQLMNDWDSPIYQNPSYFPISFRATPQWHRESTNREMPKPAQSNSGVTLVNIDIFTKQLPPWNGLDGRPAPDDNSSPDYAVFVSCPTRTFF